MLLLPLFLYNWRTQIRIYVTFVLATVAIMWVTRDQIHRMWSWYSAVAKTTARYPDEVATRSIVDGLRDIPGAALHGFPVLIFALVIVFLGLGLCLLRSNSRQFVGATTRPLLALLAAALGTLALTYKAYRVNDLVLLAPIAGALACIGFSLLIHVWATGFGRRCLVSIPVLGATIAILFGVSGAVAFVERNGAETDYRRMISYLEANSARGTYVATGYGVFSQASALLFANQSARYVSLSEVLDEYPGWLDYSIWNGQFYTFNTSDGTRLATCQELADIVNSPGGLLFAPGRALDSIAPGNQYARLVYMPERVFGSQVVYRIQSVICP